MADPPSSPPDPTAAGAPSTALLVVDVQRDFCEGGRLAVVGGAAVAAAVTAAVAADAGREVPRWALVAGSQDHHIDPGSHFAPPGTAPDFATTWPPHCVVGSGGEALHPDLVLPPSAVRVTKGEHGAAYSAFEGRDRSGALLGARLRAAGIDRVEVVGIATSYCVRATALDARRLGWPTTVLLDLCADVDPATTPATLAELRAAGVDVAATA